MMSWMSYARLFFENHLLFCLTFHSRVSLNLSLWLFPFVFLYFLLIHPCIFVITSPSIFPPLGDHVLIVLISTSVWMIAISVSLKLLYNLWLWLPRKVHSCVLQAFRFPRYVVDPSISPPLYITVASSLLVLLLLTQSSERVISEPCSILYTALSLPSNTLNLFPLRDHQFLHGLSPQILLLSPNVHIALRILFSTIHLFILLLCSESFVTHNSLQNLTLTFLYSLLSHHSFYPVNTLLSEYSECPYHLLTLSWLYFVLFSFVAFCIF